MSDKVYKNSLHLVIENKFGALERIISTFTFRGCKIENLIYARNDNPDLVDVTITVKCSDNELEKFVKILQNQVHVLNIRLIINKEYDEAMAC